MHLDGVLQIDLRLPPSSIKKDSCDDCTEDIAKYTRCIVMYKTGPRILFPVGTIYSAFKFIDALPQAVVRNQLAMSM